MAQSTESLKEASRFHGELTPEQILNAAEVIFLGDASSSSATARASEMVLAAKFAHDTGKPIVTDIYPGETIQFCISNTPYHLVVPVPESLLGEYGEFMAMQPVDDHSLHLDQTLIAQMYEPVTGIDPVAKAANILQRAVDKNTDRSAAFAKAMRLLENLPTSIFCVPDGRSYIAAVMDDRMQMISDVSQAVYGETQAITLTAATEHVRELTLRDILTRFPYLEKEMAVSFHCTECSQSLPAGEPPVKHAVSFGGVVVKAWSSFISKQPTPPKCQSLRKLTDGSLSVMDMSLDQLLNAGFSMSGKSIYAAEAMTKADAGTVLGIRDYSNPRGTVEHAMGAFAGHGIVTPRIYVQTPAGEDHMRDVTGYELMDALANGQFSDIVAFMEQLPIFSDGETYRLVLPSAVES